MRKLGKYGRTFGVIFGAALFVSGVNSAVVSNTGAPSIATYSMSYDFAERLVGAFTGPMTSAQNPAVQSVAGGGADASRFASAGDAHSGS